MVNNYIDAYTFYTPDDDDDDNDDNDDDIPHPFHRRNYIKVLSTQPHHQSYRHRRSHRSLVPLSPIHTR